MQCYDKALELDVSNTHAYRCKGNVLIRLDQVGEAMACYEEAISYKPDEIFGYVSKAGLLEQLGRGAEALAVYDAFIAAHPTSLERYLYKALLYFSRDEYEEARKTHLQGKLAAGNAN